MVDLLDKSDFKQDDQIDGNENESLLSQNLPDLVEFELPSKTIIEDLILLHTLEINEDNPMIINKGKPKMRSPIPDTLTANPIVMLSHQEKLDDQKLEENKEDDVHQEGFRMIQTQNINGEQTQT